MAQLHEYQAKQILAKHGIEIPDGKMAKTAEEAKKIAETLGGEVVVKAQIHSTSRAASGGIKFADSKNEVEQIAKEMLGKTIAGNLCEKVLIDEKAEIEREFYLGFIIDDRLKRPTLLFSDSGGSGIEERAESMKSLVCSIRQEPSLKEIKTFIESVQSPRFSVPSTSEATLTNAIAEILQKLYRVAKATEARTAEINPLALLKDGRIVALDCRISVDDYAVFRHEDLGIEIARELGHAPTKLERIAWEIEKEDFRGTYFFVEILDSEPSAVSNKQYKTKPTAHRSPLTAHYKIGFHGAGGGGSMASLDAAKRQGLSPACYVDTSGNPPASKVYRAAKIILSIPNIKGYFMSGSGVASQEQFGLARAILKAFREVKPQIPAVLRLGGNGEDYAKELVDKFSTNLPAPMEAYQKRHSAEFCASRLRELVVSSQWSVVSEEKSVPSALVGVLKLETEKYSFKTRTGTIHFDHSKFAENSTQKIVESCPAKILKADKNDKPVLAITEEEAEKGKCIECLACEFADWENEIGGVEIKFPIEGLDSTRRREDTTTG